MKKTLLIIGFYLFSFSSFAVDSYSIYLVRHAEKLTDVKDPALTACGVRRADQLANMLSNTDITEIYSTSYQRTMQTATPFANQQKLPIKNYDPRQLEQFALQLKQKKENAIVVGHSNTTPMLVGLLTKQKVAPLTEQDFKHLYQVQFINEQAVLTIFQQPLNCKAAQPSNKSN
jgi:broad specificity phosphatase PhoE